MKILKNILLIITALLFVYFFAYEFGKFYLNFYPDAGGSFLDGTGIVGIPLAYIFFIILLFSAFGDVKKYWWIGILLLPAVLFEVYFDLIHIYFPIAIGIVGWLLGKGIEIILKKIQLKKSP